MGTTSSKDEPNIPLAVGAREALVSISARKRNAKDVTEESSMVDNVSKIA